MAWGSRAWFGLVFAAACAFSSAAYADVQTELDKVRAAYAAKNYVDAEARLHGVLEGKAPIKDPALLSQARMLLGAVHFAEKKKEEATQMFEKLLLSDAGFEPDPLSFPSDVIDAFYDTRARLRDRLNAAAQAQARLDAEKRAKEELDKKKKEAWVLAIEKMASEEKIQVKNSRLVAFIPFGAGQFQNRRPMLGWALFGIESALVIGTAITLPIYVDARASEADEIAQRDPERKAAAYHDRMVAAKIVNLSLVGAFAVTAIGGIIEANVNFVPEYSEIKKRPLPKVGSGILPFAAPVENGGVAGVYGRF